MPPRENLGQKSAFKSRFLVRNPRRHSLMLGHVQCGKPESVDETKTIPASTCIHIPRYIVQYILEGVEGKVALESTCFQSTPACLKGQSNEIVDLQFLYQSIPPVPATKISLVFEF